MSKRIIICHLALICPGFILAGPLASGKIGERALSAVDRLPLLFEKNQGQFGPDILFKARANRYAAYLERNSLRLIPPGSGADDAITMSWKDVGSQSGILPLDPKVARINYLHGSD